MWSGKPAYRRLLRLACSGCLVVAAQPVWGQGPGRPASDGCGVRPAASPPMLPACGEGIVIRVRRSGSQVTASQMAHLSREADRIWAPYGVRIDWTDGTSPAVAGEAAHVVLVMLGSFECPADVPRGALAALHTAPLDNDRATSDRTAAVITVSLDRAWRMANRAFGYEQPMVRARLPVLIGRAVAHEVGHYLLESREHTNQGLMRGTYSPEDAKYALDYSLNAAQITRIRLRWAQRENAPAIASSR